MALLRRLIVVALALVALVTAAVLTQSEQHPQIELLCHFRPTVACALWAVGLGLTGTALRAATPFLLVGALVAGWPTLSLSWGGATGPGVGPALEVATINLHVSTEAYRELPQLLADADWPDVVFLCEVRREAEPVLAELRERYPHQLRWPTDEPWLEPVIGRVFLSSRPFRSALVHRSQPVLEIEIDHDGQPVEFVSAHTLRPWTDSSTAVRNGQLDYLAERAAGNGDIVVLGDLNITESSRHFAQLLEIGGLRDSRRGFGRQPSFKASFPYVTCRMRTAQALLPHLPIDHVLLGGELICVERRVGRDIGSDHRPVFARLRRRAADQ